jgi:regulation of enolase protein 1 (concanavalin A-like superfamily)
MLLFHPDSNFILKAKVSAELKEVYDVVVLVIYYDNDSWAKLCFENSAEKQATVVSVVTRKYSDDCNSAKLDNKYVYLTMVKKGKEFSFHFSKDNLNWKLVRHFRLEFPDDNLMIGFAAHCYVSKGFSAEFSEISYSNYTLENIRSYKE